MLKFVCCTELAAVMVDIDVVEVFIDMDENVSCESKSLCDHTSSWLLDFLIILYKKGSLVISYFKYFIN